MTITGKNSYQIHTSFSLKLSCFLYLCPICLRLSLHQNSLRVSHLYYSSGLGNIFFPRQIRTIKMNHIKTLLNSFFQNRPATAVVNIEKNTTPFLPGESYPEKILHPPPVNLSFRKLNNQRFSRFFKSLQNRFKNNKIINIESKKTAVFEGLF